MKPLLITYSFPPKGGPGVQRNLKFVKYLHRNGDRPSVLTVKRLAQSVEDPLLLKQVPDGVPVIRAGSLDPARVLGLLNSLRGGGSDDPVPTPASAASEDSLAYRLHKALQRWILLPDAGILWAPFAVARGVLHIRRQRIDVVVGSCPGPSALIVALTIGRLTAKPVVFDYRDGWRDYPYRSFATDWHERFDAWLEAAVIPRADGHIVFGEYLSNLLSDRYEIDDSSFTVIPNGFDPEDFERLEPWDHDDQRRRIVHSGNLMEYRVEPFRTFVEGLSRLPEEVRSGIVVDLVGNCHPDLAGIIDQYELTNMFVSWGYRSHTEALRLLLAGDASLILLPSHDTAAFTGKIFEYLAVGNPVLALANTSSGCGQIVESLGRSGAVVSPENPQEVYDALSRFDAEDWPRVEGDVAAQYDRSAQAVRFARFLSDVIDRFR